MSHPKHHYLHLKKYYSVSQQLCNNALNMRNMLAWLKSLDQFFQVSIIYEQNLYYLFDERMIARQQFAEEEEIDPLLTQLTNITQNRGMRRGESFEVVEPEYEILFEHNENTLFISLDTLEGKNFRRIVCDEGCYRLNNGFTSADIFSIFKKTPHLCKVDHSRGILSFKIRVEIGIIQRTSWKQINMEEKYLSVAARQRIKCRRIARKCLKRMKEDKQNMRKRFEEQVAKKLSQLEEQNQQHRNEIEKRLLEKQSRSYPESLIDKTTPFVKFFKITNNLITRSAEDSNGWKVVMLDTKVGKGIFSFRTCILIKRGYIEVGVTDRLTQRKNNNPEGGQSVKFFCGNISGYTYATEEKHFDTKYDLDITEGMEVLMEVERENCSVTFTVLKEKCETQKLLVKSPILNNCYHQFVPFALMNTPGDCISWDFT